jgi:hypothetical protein
VLEELIKNIYAHRLVSIRPVPTLDPSDEETPLALRVLYEWGIQTLDAPGKAVNL